MTGVDRLQRDSQPACLSLLKHVQNGAKIRLVARLGTTSLVQTDDLRCEERDSLAPLDNIKSA
jgi:hypothetical protein